MKVAELHPEDLIDKQVRGTLSRAEAEHLRAHIAGCAVCRFEYAARAAFAGDAERLQGFARAEHASERARLVSRRPRGRAPRFALVATAVWIMAGIAIGAAVSSHLQVQARREATEATSDAKERHPNREPVGVEERSELGASDSAPSVPRPPIESGTASLAGPAGDSPNLSAACAASTPPPRTPRREPKAADAPSAPTAAQLFASANHARRAGDVAAATRLYVDLQDRFPESDEAFLSNATLARMWLDRGDANAALLGFDRYLGRGGGPLGEEAIVGKALALQRLGRRQEEAAAWRDVLRLYPHSLHARRASSRLEALGE